MTANRVEITLGAKDEASSVIEGLVANLRGMAGQLIAMAGLAGGGLGFGMLVNSGIEFNKTIEDSKSGLAALVLSSHNFTTATGKAATAQQALATSFQVSNEMQQDFLEIARTTAASYTDLVKAFQTAYGPAMAAGITNLDKLKQVTVSASQAVSALGLDSRQLTQEIRAIFTGEMSPDNTLNRVLGITKVQLDEVRKSGGDVADFLIQKMKPFADAAAASTGNWSVVLSNAKDSLDQMMGAASKPLFQVIKQAFADTGGLMTEIQSDMDAMGRSLAEGLKEAIPVLTDLVRLLVAAAGSVIEFGGATGVAATMLRPLIQLLTEFLKGGGDLVLLIGAGSIALKTLAGAFTFSAASGAAFAAGLEGIGVSMGLLTAASGALVLGVGALVAVWLSLRAELKEAEKMADQAAAGNLQAINDRLTNLQARVTSKVHLEWITDLKKEIAAGTINADQATKSFMGLTASIKSLQQEGAKVILDPKKVVDPEALKKQLELAKKLTADNAKEILSFQREQEQAAQKWAGALPKLLGLMGDSVAAAKAEVEEKYRKAAEEIRQALVHGLSFNGELVTPEVASRLFGNLDTRIQKEVASAVAKATEELQKIPGAYQRALEIPKPVFGQVQEQLRILLSDFKRGVITLQEYWAGVAPVLYRTAQTASQGVAAGWAGILGDLKTTGQATADFMRGVWDTIGKGFEDSVYNVISGKAQNLGDVLKGVWDDILRTFSQFITKMVQAAILGDQRAGQTGMFSGLFASGDGSSGSGGGGAPTSADWASKMGAPGGSQGFNWGAALAGGLAGAGAGYSISGNSTGAVIGAVSGIIATVVGGWIGALVAVIGAGLAAFAKDNTEVREYLMGTRTISAYGNMASGGATGRWGRDDLGQGTSPGEWASQWGAGSRHATDFSASLGSTRNRLVELLRGSGLEEDLAKGLDEAITKILTEMNVKVFAGSSQDLQANWKDLIQKWGPEWLIKTAFGFTPSGGDKLLGGIEGVPGFAQFDAKTAKGPITEMMRTLGFTNQAIQTIADQIDLRDLDAWMEWFSNIISIVRKGKEVSALLGGSVADEAAKRSATSGLDAILASGKDLTASFAGLDLLTGDERVTKTKELLDLAEQQYEAGLAYYMKVKAIFDQLQAGIDKLLLDTQNWSAGKGADWLLQDTRNAAANNRQWFLDEADPEKAAQYAKVAIESAALVIQGLRAMYEQAKALKADVDNLIEGFSDPSKGINPSTGLTGYLEKAFALMSSIAKAASLSGQAQLDAIANIKMSAEDLYRTQQQLLQAVADQTKALKEGVADTRWQLDYGDMNPQQQAVALKERIQGLMSQLHASTDPAEIGRLQSQIRQYLTQYYGLFSKDDPNRAAAHQWVDEILTILEETGVDALAGIRATVESWSTIIADGLKKVSTDLGTQMTALKTEIEKWTEWLKTLRSEIDTKLKGVATALETANAALKTQVDLATGYFLNLNSPSALPQTKTSIDQSNAAFDRSTLSVNAFKAALDKATVALGGAAPASTQEKTTSNQETRSQAVQDVITVLRRNPSILRGAA